MKKIMDYFIYVILIALLGQVYFYPFNSEFRFSLSVIFLIVILFYSPKINAIILSSLSGFMIIIIRALPLIMELNIQNFQIIIKNHIPALIYYISFGLFFTLFKIRKKVKKNYFNIAFIIAVDAISNIIELLFRLSDAKEDLEIMILAIVLVAILRTILISLIIYALEINKIKNQKEKFKELIFINAGLNSELFYLKKSTMDIENAMEKSYRLYEEINDIEKKEKALELAKSIHEIKKDYKRVIDGINYNIKKSLRYKMDFKELINIIEVNSKKQIFNSNKKIKISFNIKDNFHVYHYYSLITIINNLIINAIDAIENKGEINFIEWSDEDEIHIEIRDSGCGISKEDQNVIFEPGFTTKYDKTTGEMSSGLGLIHVKNIIEKVFEGEIHVISNENDFTKFVIIIDKNKMEE